MKRTLITIVLTTLVVLTLVGIVSSSFLGLGSPSIPLAGYRGGGYPSIEAMPAMPEALSAGGGGGEETSFAAFGDVATLSTERLVIENVDMSIVVSDPKASMEEIADMAKEMGGWVVSSNLYQTQYGPNSVQVPEASITIRVPAARLDEALEKIRAGAVDVTYENRTGQDVTSEYIDLQSRLAAKQAAEKKLLEILEEAKETEDVLAVYSQLQQIQSEIEVLKGQIKYYDESVAYSAISIRLVAEETVEPIEIGGWKLQGTVNDAIQDLIRFTQGFTRFLIRFFLSYLPAMLMIALPVYGLYLGGRAVVRRFKKSKAAPEVKEEGGK
ncbi:MAG TPA: DUF4349 domain-containing protein [Anaerolineales bacterium]|nr:DUF4349 domain-containing protein [Anaerolineales bacterium]